MTEYTGFYQKSVRFTSDMSNEKSRIASSDGRHHMDEGTDSPC